MKFEYRSRAHGLAELHLVDGGKKHQLVISITAKRDAHHAGSGLRHGLDDQDARHDRIVGEMPGEIRLADTDHLNANRAMIRNNLLDPFDQQHGRPVRDPFLDLVNIKFSNLIAHSLLFLIAGRTQKTSQGRTLAPDLSRFLSRKTDDGGVIGNVLGNPGLTHHDGPLAHGDL